MKAIILAGGKGTRLKPLTDDLPKPMVKIINKPLLEYIVMQLKGFGFTEIALSLGYRSECIRSYFGDGKKFGVKLRYYVEEMPLGTAGAVKNCADFIGNEDVLVVSGDAFTDADLSSFFYFHKYKKALVTLALKRVSDPTGFGVVRLDRKNRVTRFVEKPTKTSETLVNMGIYALNPRVLQYIPDGPFDFGRQLFPRLVGKIHGIETSCYWSDIGTLSSYYSTNKFVAESPLLGKYFMQ